MFRRIVVGVDGSPVGFEALRQAKRLLAPGGRLLAVTAVYPQIAVHAGFDAPRVAEQLWAEARAAREAAASIVANVAGAEARLVEGRAIDTLLAAAARESADLLAVGTHGGSRAAGIAFGSVATALLHEAPCPVLVARPAADPERFPRSLVAGYDGSEPARAAAELASELGERFGAPVRTVVATGGKPLTLDHFPVRAGMEADDRHPVDALVAASRDTDLLVIGCRGLHGLGALGSVSERTAHRAACSVLVVRPIVAGSTPRLPATAEAAL